MLPWNFVWSLILELGFRFHHFLVKRLKFSAKFNDSNQMSINLISARQRGGRVARWQRGQVQGERGLGRHPLVGRPQTEDGQAGFIRPHRSQQVNRQRNIHLKKKT